MKLDPKACYQAVRARDARFDGRFFTCVTSTGIYCRPICSAKIPRFENCRFVPSAAAAQTAGFRPCLRCRPELSPDVAAWKGTQSTVSKALALLAEGALDGSGGVEALADRLGLGDRQVRRLFEKHLGASPVAVAQTRRLLFAKQLLQDTRLSMADVALASGFGSIRRFNTVFRALYGRPPSTIRGRSKAGVGPDIVIRLGYRPPYDWDAMLAFFGARAIAGVELVEAGVYRRTIAVEGGVGTLSVEAGKNVLVARLRVPSVATLPSLAARLRRLFDLDADIQTIARHLAQDRGLAPLVARRPGLRLPGSWDGFELAVRALLGQQVSLQAARGLGRRLAETVGSPVDPEITGDPRLTLTFPTPEQVARLSPKALPMPSARLEALRDFARSVQQNPRLLPVEADLEGAVAHLRGLRGFGEWTAHYVALRALGQADAFPVDDAALRRAMSQMTGADPVSRIRLLSRAERWRPWRGYAAQHLWTAGAALSEVPRG